MSSVKFFMIFVFLISLSKSLFTFAIEAKPNYLHHVCSNNTFTVNSTYQTNLNLVLSSLASNANGSNGFSNATAGQDLNRIYGLFQCRSDLKTTTCQDCVVFASTEVTQRCPTQKGNVIWYDECLVHYSDSYIFSTVTTSPSFSLFNTDEATEPVRFRQLVLGLMNVSTTLAANNTKRYATRRGNPQPQKQSTLFNSARRTCQVMIALDVLNKLLQICPMERSEEGDYFQVVIACTNCLIFTPIT
ncbi:hypothetical protein Ddye_019568 [Dipteronia dyeriana]|uniref:Gnk2-homologous domain-containing protein n=1 Tax=Dipteronia dyeriana TaxID=168575 RepID=A0AAD9WVR8_9ROSI|nr:hypothetical protein Ddye_019568 [Dipteronia dyeriana]